MVMGHFEIPPQTATRKAMHTIH